MTKEELQKIFNAAEKETATEFSNLTVEKIKRLYADTSDKEYELQFLIPFELSKRLTFHVLEKILCTSSPKDSERD